jgi:hypothetical protein
MPANSWNPVRWKSTMSSWCEVGHLFRKQVTSLDDDDSNNNGDQLPAIFSLTDSGRKPTIKDWSQCFFSFVGLVPQVFFMCTLMCTDCL